MYRFTAAATGNRQRVDFQHVRADDTEIFNVELASSDAFLLHTPSERLSAPQPRSLRHFDRIEGGRVRQTV